LLCQGVNDLRDFLSGRHQAGFRPDSTHDKPLPSLADILKIPATIEGYEIIPVWLDLGDIAQDKLAIMQMLAFVHVVSLRTQSIIKISYINLAIIIPEFRTLSREYTEHSK
jgi:hypothetical protein